MRSKPPTSSRDHASARTLCAAVAVLVLAACNRDPAPGTRPAAPPPADTAPGDTVHQTASGDDALAATAAARIRAAMPPGGTLTVLVSTGDGARAAHATEALRNVLGSAPGVVFSTVSRQPGGAVADPGTPGGHVNTEGYTVAPAPQVVVRISESGPTLYIAARPPGRDPLGPPDEGWSWVLSWP